MSVEHCTVVSLLPWKLTEEKPGLYPGQFNIAAAPKDGISILVVGESVFQFYVGDGRFMPMKEPADVIARSICRDYKLAKLGFKIGEEGTVGPGLFFVEGKFTEEEVKSRFVKQIQDARKEQMDWFEALMNLADDIFARTGRHQAVSDEMRHVCNLLGQTRPWNFDINTLKQTSECPACLSQIPQRAIVCAQCKTIVNQAEFDKRKFKQAS